MYIDLVVVTTDLMGVPSLLAILPSPSLDQYTRGILYSLHHLEKEENFSF